MLEVACDYTRKRVRFKETVAVDCSSEKFVGQSAGGNRGGRKTAVTQGWEKRIRGTDYTIPLKTST